MLPVTNATGALQVVERLRAQLEANPAVHQHELITVTASFGLACSHSEQSLDQLLARADRALYQAKHQGKNYVVLAGE